MPWEEQTQTGRGPQLPLRPLKSLMPHRWATSPTGQATGGPWSTHSTGGGGNVGRLGKQPGRDTEGTDGLRGHGQCCALGEGGGPSR